MGEFPRQKYTSTTLLSIKDLEAYFPVPFSLLMGIFEPSEDIYQVARCFGEKSS